MRVAGLDLSLTGTAVCSADGSTRTLSSPYRGIDRLSDLRHKILAQLGARDEVLADRPDLVVLEGYSFGARGSAVIDLGQLGGVIRLAMADEAIPWAEIPPQSLKKFATGKGNANKTDMAIAAYKAWGLEFADDNQCDACWLRAIGLYRYGEQLLSATAYRDEVVSKLDWPDLAVPA